MRQGFTHNLLYLVLGRWGTILCIYSSYVFTICYCHFAFVSDSVGNICPYDTVVCWDKLSGPLGSNMR